MTSRERAHLKSLAAVLDPIFHIGKSSLTPEFTEAIREALEARELIKINVLKNCMDDPSEIAGILAERTGAEVVQVIGKKIVLYKENKEKHKKQAKQGEQSATKKNTLGTNGSRNAAVKSKKS